MDEHFQQSLQLWPLLVLAAKNRQTLTYGMVEKMTNIDDHLGQAKPLGNIYLFCKYNELPCLNLLVVNQQTGKPSTREFEALDIPNEHARIFNFDWDKWAHHHPTAQALQEAREKWEAEKAAA